MGLRAVLEHVGPREECCVVGVEGVFGTLYDLLPPSVLVVPELSILTVTGTSNIEVAFVLQEEVLEEEESLPDSSEVEEFGRILVKCSGLDPALEVIWSINRSRFLLDGSETDVALMVLKEALRKTSESG